MKKMLLMLIISMSVLAYRTPDIMAMIGMATDAKTAQSNAAGITAAGMSAASVTTAAMTSKVKPPRGMTMAEFAELSKKDPNAYRKLMESNTIPVPRTEGDKLMNFFAHGKYE